MIPLSFTVFESDLDMGYSVQESALTHLAQRKFECANTKSRLLKIWKSLTRRPWKLHDLKTAAANRSIRKQHYQGVSAVPIDKILGSENRADDFDVQFNPLHSFVKPRWVKIAVAMLQGALPAPVELIRFNDIYFVRDGHHRISVARALLQKEIDANVTVWE